jgi:hypothetical protein
MPKSTATLLERLQRFAEASRRSFPVVEGSNAVVLVAPGEPAKPLRAPA